MVLIANQIYKFKRLVQIRIDFETRAFMNFDEPSLLVEWVANDGVLADIVDSFALVDPSFVA